MASLNKVMLIGNLGRDPEVRMTQSGAKVASFSIAITERYKDRNGAQQEKTEWVNIILWNRLGEIAEQYLRKGSPVYIEGKLQTSSWDDPSGVKKYKTEVVGNSMQMLGGKSGGQGGAPGEQGGYAQQGAGSFDSAPSFNQPSTPTFKDAPPPEDDLPF